MSSVSIATVPDRLVGSDRYINREYSWLQFNARVLAQSADDRVPLLERVRFLAIFESNLDEFYMVRVSGLIEQYEARLTGLSPDGLSPREQIDMIHAIAHPLRRSAADLLSNTLLPLLSDVGIEICSYDSLRQEDRDLLGRYFEKEIFPVCTPLALDPAHTLPFISSRSLNLAVELNDVDSEYRLARVKVPPVVPRLVRVSNSDHRYVLLEDLIAHNLHHLFPGLSVSGCYRFRVVRDADVEIQELEASDLISSVEEAIRRRRFGAPVLLEVNPDMPDRVRDFLMKMLDLDVDDVCVTPGILGLDVCDDLSSIDISSCHFDRFTPYVAEPLSDLDSMFDVIRASDFLIHHPFDSFAPVELFVGGAAEDPDVIGIKQTLYRVGSASPIVESLLNAAEAGKQVAVMVELKARFDESNNLVWARALERAGVHVTYGFRDLKTHCKLCLIVRREGGSIRSYAHVSTGNYNPLTAKVYTDIGLFTCDPDITQDLSELFNFLTGFSRQEHFRRILVAPLNLREGVIDRIEREIEHAKSGRPSHIIFKMNALVDPEVIDLLYEANRQGVRVDLLIRGVCCLRPGVAGLSDRIRVTSIVGRFLEHSRILYFENGGDREALIGSADMMRRNLDRRVEILVPISASSLVSYLRDVVLESYLKDNVNAWDLESNGGYLRREVSSGAPVFCAQEYLISHSATRYEFGD
jgi:polyphosphate kinase